MLLTITTTHRPATDLGYLLHKHPARLQTFPVTFGQVHVFYPEASEERCTAALLLDVDAIGLGVGTAALSEKVTGRLASLERYVAAYRQYCWPVRSVDDLRLAPFHLLATEGHCYTDRDHGWHREHLAPLAAAGGGVVMATDEVVVDLADPAAEAAATRWWEELTAAGGEGMVVKPWTFIAHGPRGLVQPAVKCRGVEYLRIIYGPDYTADENLTRLRARGLSAKRSLALREFALGVEGLERFVRREPLRRVHECVFGVLAMESEPVDPRL